MASARAGSFGRPPVESELRAREVTSSHRIGFWRRMATDGSALAGLVIVGSLLIVAALGPFLVPKDPLAIDPLHSLEAPSLGHLFGTDHLGRDTLSRVVAGARISVSIALFTGLAILMIGVAIGAIAGYVGRWIDSLTMRGVDILLAFPTLILSLAIAGALGSGYETLVIALVLTWWPAYARLIRGSVLAEREREYVEALRGLGARPRRIVVRHILPNALPPVLVLLSFDLGGIILAIAALGYLGVGISPPTPEWGTMVSDARTYVFATPWVIVFPGLAIAYTVVGFNLLGEGLREALDPHLSVSRPRRWRRGPRLVRPTLARNRRPVVTWPAMPAPVDESAGADLLRVDGLVTHIQRGSADVRAVDGVSLWVGSGETVGLVGESGCGKTMTGLSIMRLLPRGGRIMAGRICFGGRDMTGAGEVEMRRVRGREIAMVFQDPMSSLNPTMTIGDQIASPVRYHLGLSRRAARERAAEVLSLVGMPRPLERLSDFPHQLSGGLRQRAMIAMALACEPKLLIADEPTTSLDVTIQAQILALLDDLKTQLGMAMILITHDMGVIAGMANRVLVMYAGRIVESAPTATLFHRRRHPYTQALLDSIPQIDLDPGRRLETIPGMPPDLADPPPSCRFAPRCRFASNRCHLETPLLAGDGDAHVYACFHPVAAPRESERIAHVASSRRAATEGSDGGDRGRLVAVEGLVKEYLVGPGLLARGRQTVKAVSDVTFTVTRGETLGLVGESGCGKTTLARMLVALERPDAGRVLIEGVDATTLPAPELRRRRGDVQLTFQNAYAALDPRLRVGDALQEPMIIQAVGTKGQREARVAELLGEVGLDITVAALFPHQLSGGQRQRVGFARALVLNPRLVVADEPVSALDVSIRSQILNLLKRLQEDHDLTLVVISHDLSVIRYLATRVGVMHLGKLVEIGPTEQVYERPAHPYTAGLLAAIPIPDPARARATGRLVVKGELPSAITPPSGCRFRTRCPLAADVCAEKEPPMQRFGPLGHTAACHFPLQPALATPAEG